MRASVDEPSPEFPEQLKDFLFRCGRIKVVECGDGHCGIRCFVRHGNQAIGNEMHAVNQSHVSGAAGNLNQAIGNEMHDFNQSHVSGGRRALAEVLLKHEDKLMKLLSPFL